MDSVLNTLRSNLILQSVALIVAGLVLLAIPGVTMLTLVFVLAFMLIIIGVWAIISYVRTHSDTDIKSAPSRGTLVYGIALSILPIIMFIVPDLFATIISIVAGALLLGSGLVNITRSMKLKALGDNSWIISLIISLIIAAGGIMLIIDPFGSAALFARILGLCLVINGLADLLIVFWSRNLDTMA